MRPFVKSIALVAVSVAALLLVPLAGAAWAQGQVKVIPWQFGLGANAAWLDGPGEPGQPGDPKNQGLYLQKGTATASYAAAGATVTFSRALTGTTLTHLGFDISGVPGEGFDAWGGTTHGYCGAGAPRINVYFATGTCFLGCTYGGKVQDAGTGWWAISFTPPFDAYPGCGGISGSISGIEIVLDEGTDVGPGNVVLDNIRVNNIVVGRQP